MFSQAHGSLFLIKATNNEDLSYLMHAGKLVVKLSCKNKKKKNTGW